jgi:LPXTG-motif cell wall-anchored protein
LPVVVPETVPNSDSGYGIIELPVTGGDSGSPALIAFVLLASGFAVFMMSKRNN